MIVYVRIIAQGNVCLVTDDSSGLGGPMWKCLRPVDDPLWESRRVDRRVTLGDRPVIEPAASFFSDEFVCHAIGRIT
jgi:hypothetical protein